MSTGWQVAQMNIGNVLYSLDDERMSGFVDQLDEINALADASPGFVWRLQSDSGNATDIPVSEDPSLLVNMSVWQSVEALYAFAYQSAHRLVLADRRKWFRRPEGAYQVLWWVPAGHQPTVEEGLSRLALLRSSGPRDRAFNFRAKFPPPGKTGATEDLNPQPYCSGWE